MNQLNSASASLLPLSAKEIGQVSGGAIEKEGIRPRKFGDVDYLVYVDGVLIGTTYGPASSPVPTVGSGTLDPTLTGRLP